MSPYNITAAILMIGTILGAYATGHRDGKRDEALLGPIAEKLPFHVLEEKIGSLWFYTVTEAGKTNKTIFVHTSSSGTLTLFRKD